MLKRTLLAGTLAFWMVSVKAQTARDSLAEKTSRSNIELVYNHYLQNGNNSAVTGGIGTEKLSVFAPALHFNKTSKSAEFGLHLGCDVITSASTDNIDYVVSSASKHDLRTYSNFSWTQNLPSNRMAIKGGAGFSVESDYLSLSGLLGTVFKDKTNQRTFSVQFQYVKDDLRWGRLNPSYYKPVSLVYPAELRGRKWLDDWKRESFNLRLSLTQIVNQRNTLGLFPEVSFQKGLLSTPFHRVYFSDASVAVEKLPEQRLKLALGLKWNRFVGGRLILKTTVNGYRDNFGIQAFSFEEEVVLKLTSAFSIFPQVRIYTQTGATYFGKFRQASKSARFYTSDYDLSAFETWSGGLGIKIHPQKYMNKKWVFDALILRFNHSYRTNGLSSNQISMVLQTHKNPGRK